MITQKQLKDHLHYDDVSGLFTRKTTHSNKFKIGTVAGSIGARGYHIIKIFGKIYSSHRLVFLYMLGDFPVGDVDHIDGDKLNNKWDNLRVCTHSENIQNSKLSTRNTSGVKGVSFNSKLKKWNVTVNVAGKNRFFGYYSDLELADLVATEARELYHGTYARHS